MLKSFSDRRKDIFNIISEQLKGYSLYFFDYGKIAIRSGNYIYKESKDGKIIIEGKGKTIKFDVYENKQIQQSI